METALAPRMGLDLDVFEKAEAIAGKLARSTLLPSAVRGKPADLAVILVTGQELGLSPMQALRGLHVVEGRPVLAAELLVGLVKKHPACQYFRLVESTDSRAVYETQRQGEPEPTRLEWTIKQAQQAGLGGRHNWKAHPAAMLRARASAALARAVYPDVAMGIYDVDEAADFIEVSKGVHVEAQTKAPTPPQANGAAAEDVEDAVVVEAVQADDGAPDPEDLEETWVERIAGAADARGLAAVGKLLQQRFPDKDHPIRLNLRGPYADRQKALRREAQQ